MHTAFALSCQNRIKPLISTLAALALSGSSAFAHITLVEKEAPAGSSYRAIFSVPHGCAGSATTKITITIPEGVIGIKPMPKAGWSVALSSGAYAKPYRLYGRDVSSGVKTVTYTGGPLPDYEYDEFLVSMYLADDLPTGHDIVFPTIQTCETGENRWVLPPSPELHHTHNAPTAGATPMDEPAPALLITAAAGNVAKAAPLVFKDLAISGAVARATPMGVDISAAYLTIENIGTQDDTLLSVTTGAADMSQIHEMAMDNGIMRMRERKDGLRIPAGKSVSLQPGGNHIMLMGLKAPLKEGDAITLALTFARAGTVSVPFGVGGLGAGGLGAGGLGAGGLGAGGHEHPNGMNVGEMPMNGQ